MVDVILPLTGDKRGSGGVSIRVDSEHKLIGEVKAMTSEEKMELVRSFRREVFGDAIRA